METKTTGKKIVSKGAYVQAQGKRLLLFGGGASYYLFSAVCLVTTVFLLCSIYVKWPVFSPSINEHPAECLGLLFSSIIGAVIFWRWGRDTHNQAKQAEVVIPFTRANTAALPAPDSLVRASSEPLQAQHAVLLRAAAEGQETPLEQLVRASMGQE